MRRLTLLGVALFLGVSLAVAQDPVKVDPKHYKVVLENDQVRVLRITFGPKEKSVMHEHPASVAVFLTAGHVRHTTPDGKATEEHPTAGAAVWNPHEKHLPENIGDKPFELILVELKGKAAAAKSAAAAKKPGN